MPDPQPAPAGAAPDLLTPARARRAALSGLCARFVGIGLARFAYTPLIPALISAHWFSWSEATYLGAANLAGLAGQTIAARPASIRAMAV